MTDLEAVVERIMEYRGFDGDRRPIKTIEPKPKEEPEGDWRGEHFLKVKPAVFGGQNMKKATGRKSNNLKRIEARRASVTELHKAGKAETEIAATLGCSHSTVYHDLAAMGLRV